MLLNFRPGLAYVQGSLFISPRALARLKELGVAVPSNPFPQGGDFLSFYLDMAHAQEFLHYAGNPANAGKLYLRAELAAEMV